MTRKKIILGIALLALIGCATAAPQFYRARGSEVQHTITGKSVGRFYKIYVDGEEVISKATGWLSGNSEATGNFHGKVVSSSCHTALGLLTDSIVCTVFMDNERAATLTF
jgi:hypothetical protein